MHCVTGFSPAKKKEEEKKTPLTRRHFKALLIREPYVCNSAQMGSSSSPATLKLRFEQRACGLCRLLSDLASLLAP